MSRRKSVSAVKFRQKTIDLNEDAANKHNASVKVVESLTSDLKAKLSASTSRETLESQESLSSTAAELNKRSVLVRSIYAKARKRLHEDNTTGSSEGNKLAARQKLIRAAHIVRDSAKETMFSKNAIQSFLSIADDQHERLKLQAEVDMLELELQKQEEPLLGLPALLGEIVGSTGSKPPMSEKEIQKTMANMSWLQDHLASLKEQFEHHRRHSVRIPPDLTKSMRDVQNHLDTLMAEINAMKETIDEASQKALESANASQNSQSDEVVKELQNAVPHAAQNASDPQAENESPLAKRGRRLWRSCAIAMVFDQVLFHDFLGNIQNLATDVSALSQEQGGISLQVAEVSLESQGIPEESIVSQPDRDKERRWRKHGSTLVDDDDHNEIVNRPASLQEQRFQEQSGDSKSGDSRSSARTARASIGGEKRPYDTQNLTFHGDGSEIAAYRASRMSTSQTSESASMPFNSSGSYELSHNRVDGFVSRSARGSLAMGTSSYLESSETISTTGQMASTTRQLASLQPLDGDSIGTGYVNNTFRAMYENSTHQELDPVPERWAQVPGIGTNITPRIMGAGSTSRPMLGVNSHHIRSDALTNGSIFVERSIGRSPGVTKRRGANRIESHLSPSRTLDSWGFAKQQSGTHGRFDVTPRRLFDDDGSELERPRRTRRMIDAQQISQHNFQQSKMQSSSSSTSYRFPVFVTGTTPSFCASPRFAELSDYDSEGAQQMVVASSDMNSSFSPRLPQMVVPSRVMASSLSPRLPRLIIDLHPDPGMNSLGSGHFSKTAVGFHTQRPNFQASTLENIIEDRKRRNIRYKDLWKDEYADIVV